MLPTTFISQGPQFLLYSLSVIIRLFGAFILVQSLSCVRLCNPIDCSTLGFPVLHHLPEFAQTHAHWISGAIQPSHPLSSPSPPAFSLSQHQGLLQWVSSSHQVAKVLELQSASAPFNGGSAGKESVCNMGDLGSIRGLGRSLEEGNEENTPVFWPGEFHGLYSPWGLKEPDMTEWLSLSFRIDWFDLLTVQGTLKSLLQQHGFIFFLFYFFNSMVLKHQFFNAGYALSSMKRAFIHLASIQSLNCVSLHQHI